MRRALLNVITFFFLSACAQADDQERDYAGVFDGLNIPSRHMETIKFFDRMAFADDQERYVSAGVQKVMIGKGPKYIYQAYSKYAGSLSRKNKYIGGNDATLRYAVLSRHLAAVGSYSDADILLLGVDLISDELQAPTLSDIKKWLGFSPRELLKHEVYNNQSSCKIYSAVSHGKVNKTLILVKTAPWGANDPTMSAVACINRGHYAHFGFLGSLQLDDSVFVQWGDVAKAFIVNADYTVTFPIFFQDGSMAGKARKEVLRALALKASR